jgi:hypothetical protein
MNSISGVGFEEAWTGRRKDEVLTPGGPIAIHLIGLRSLRINKASSGRPKDLDDLSHLPEPA